ncbi:MAG TPA: ABC transporter permease [Thermoanaerobaculia bacterium]|nr:ABC transporter permease [Thermoanaerobaculia bacterium]
MRSRSGTLGLAAFLAVAVLPIGASLVYALLYSVGLAGLLREGFTGRHWLAVLGGGEVWASLLLSALVAAAVVAISTALGLALAVGFRGALDCGLLGDSLYLPLALPGAVAAFFVFQMLTGGGLVARVLIKLGVLSDSSRFVPLVQDRWAVGIILAHTLLAAPFLALLFARLYESERVAEMAALSQALGASRRQSLWRVEVPILLHAAGTNLALLFIVVLGSYEIPLLLGRQAPQMLSVLTMRKFALFDLRQKPEAFVVALLYTGIVMALITGLFRRGRVDG